MKFVDAGDGSRQIVQLPLQGLDFKGAPASAEERTPVAPSPRRR